MILKKTHTEPKKQHTFFLKFYKFLTFLTNPFLNLFGYRDYDYILKVEIYKNSIAVCDKIRCNVEQLEKKGYKVLLELSLSETTFLNSSQEDDLALEQLIDQLEQRKVL